MKNIPLILSVLVLITLFASCDKSGEFVCTSDHFIFLDKDGEDIFNPNSDIHIDTSDFKVFTPENKEYHITLGFNDSLNAHTVDVGINGKIGREDTTFFRFGDYNIDTIRAVWSEEGFLHIDEMYYNDSLIESFCNTPKAHKIIIKPDSIYN